MSGLGDGSRQPLQMKVFTKQTNLNLCGGGLDFACRSERKRSEIILNPGFGRLYCMY